VTHTLPLEPEDKAFRLLLQINIVNQTQSEEDKHMNIFKAILTLVVFVAGRSLYKADYRTQTEISEEELNSSEEV